MTQFLLVCLGEAVGSGARYAVALAVPYATLPGGGLRRFARRTARAIVLP